MKPSMNVRAASTRDALPVMRNASSSPAARGVGPSDIFCDLCYAGCNTISDPVLRAACYAACKATVC